MTHTHDNSASAADDANQGVIVTRNAVLAQINARLSGQIDDRTLSAWAFDRFYAEETGMEDFEPGMEPAIAEALDNLMFGDDPHFRLDETELRALAARLSEL